MESILTPSENEEEHFQLFTIIAIDGIWFLRNKIVHDAYRPTIESFMSGTLKTFREQKYAWGSKQMYEPYNGIAIARDHYILYFDVVVRNIGSTVLAICRSNDGFLPK